MDCLMTSQETVDILVVDDEPDIRFMLSFALGTIPGIRVAGEAIHGAHAVELVEQGCPDVVLLDLQMPVMDGLEALARIKQLCEHSKVVMFSSAYAPELVEVALNRGADMYLPKSTPPSKIAEALLELCA